MAYWSEGKDIGDRKILAAEAGAVGINGGQIAELLDSGQDVESVKAEITHATTIGVTGVPTFIFAQSYALVGAQSADVLADAITRVAREAV
jgi:predicted DsbA family dithiol-disulfide isomerase